MINFKPLIKKFPSVWPSYWNNKWAKGSMSYRTITGGSLVDVKSVLKPTTAEVVAVGDRLKREVCDDSALACLRYVINNVAYVSDSKKYGKPERWQVAAETFKLKTGDCEDGAILLMKLLEAASVPAWRRKLCCGWVATEQGKCGHAYVIYLADDFEWYVLDWCYWPLSAIDCFKKFPHRNRKQYGKIWFTFNEEFCWPNQEDTIVKWK